MKPWIILAFLLGLLMQSGGCAEVSDTHYGKAYRRWFDSQAVNLEAPGNPAPAMTLSGKVAMGIEEKRYIPAMTEKVKDRDRNRIGTQFGIGSGSGSTN